MTLPHSLWSHKLSCMNSESQSSTSKRRLPISICWRHRHESPAHFFPADETCAKLESGFSSRRDSHGSQRNGESGEQEASPFPCLRMRSSPNSNTSSMMHKLR